MVDQDKKMLLDILSTVREACISIDISCGADYTTQVLTDCQDAVISVGDNLEGRNNSLDKTALSETGVIKKLEKLCEEFFELSQGFSEEIKVKIIQIIDEVSDLISLYPKTYRVAFLPYSSAMWDCLESIWQEFATDDRCETAVVPIPYFEKDRIKGEMVPRYDGARFPENVPVTFFGEYILAEKKPDIVFVHNPFDSYNFVTTVHPDYYSEELKKNCTRLVYVPYYINAGHMSANYIDLPLLYRADAIVVQNEVMKSECREKPYYDRILPLGSPKFDKLIRLCRQGIEPPTEWGDFCREKKRILLNTTVEDVLQHENSVFDKLRILFETVKTLYNDITLIWRPHPLLESTIRAMRGEIIENYYELRDYFTHNDIGVLDSTSDSAVAIASCDAYIGSAYSSVIVSFTATGKPCLGLNYNVTSVDSENRILSKEAFSATQGWNLFEAYESDIYSVIDFLEDVSNNRLGFVEDMAVKELERISSNTDGTCGKSVHRALMETM